MLHATDLHEFLRLIERLGVIDALQEEGHALVPGHVAQGVQVQPSVGIGKAVLPAGDAGVVVTTVHHVPAQHHVAKTKAPFGQGFGDAQELVAVQVLAAQHTIDVADGHLDALRAGFANGRDGGMLLGCGLGSGAHRVNPCIEVFDEGARLLGLKTIENPEIDE